MSQLFKTVMPVGVSIKDISADDQSGVVEAIVSVFGNVDSAKEVVVPGAFKNSLNRKMPRVCWGHSWLDIIGKTVDARELSAGDSLLPETIRNRGGLYVKVQLNLDIQRAKEAYSLLKNGDVEEWSIGYKVIRSHRVTDEGSQDDDAFGLGFGNSVRYLDELELYEVSPVLAGANDMTVTLGVKNSDLSLGEQIEESLDAFKVVWSEAKALLDRRQKVGRELSAANVGKLEGFATSLEDISAGIRTMLESTKRKDGDPGTEPKPDQPVAEDYSAEVIRILAQQTLRRNQLILTEV